MKLAARPLVLIVIGAAVAYSQAKPEQKPPTADQVFKSVKVLKGLPVDQFMATMGFISASLGETCTDCHAAESGGSWEKYADETKQKQTARSMIVMMNAINKAYFGGRREITCYSCHRGVERPKVTPSLVDLYGPPAPASEPDELLQPAPKAPSAEQILDKYIQAIGGAEKLAALTSFAAKGTNQSYAETDKSPVDVFAKAPAQRATIIHTPAGDSSTIYDGHTGWIAAPATERPVQLVELTGGDLLAAKLDADLTFPARIQQALSQWRVSAPASIDNRDVQVVQGTSDGRFPVNFYFDSKTGLLVRVVRYTESPLGLNPTQIDYSDYRDVAGVKMPFHWTTTWLDGRATIELTEVRPNASVDAARFGKPAAPAAVP